MAKSFKRNIEGADKLFSANDYPSSNKQDTPDIRDMKDTSDINHRTKPKEYYRFNLKLDIKLEEYIRERAWLERMSITDYINNLIREDMKKQNNNNK